MIESLLAAGAILLSCCVSESEEAGCRLVRTCQKGSPICHEVCHNVVMAAGTTRALSAPAGYAIPWAVGAELVEKKVCDWVCEPVEYCTYKEECGPHIYNGQSG